MRKNIGFTANIKRKGFTRLTPLSRELVADLLAYRLSVTITISWLRETEKCGVRKDTILSSLLVERNY